MAGRSVASPAMDLRIFIEPQQGASYEQQLAVAQLAEELGFDRLRLLAAAVMPHV